MYKVKILLILFPLLTCSGKVFSAVSESTIVEGKIIGFDAKTVTLLIQKDKYKTTIKIPKKSVPKYFKIKIDNNIRAVLDGKELLEKLKKRREKRRSKKKKKH